MKDEKNRITRPATHTDPTKNLYIGGRSWYRGIEPTKKKPQWNWQLYIAGQSAGLDKISKVDWTLHWSATSRKTVMRNKRLSQYQVIANTYTPGKFKIDARITFKNNTTRTLTRTFLAAQQYNLRLIQTDRYWGKDRSGQSRWDWWAKIDGSLTQLNDIKQVTYHLHPTFKPKDRVIRGSLQNGFAFKSNGWGTFNLAATVDLKDGRQIKLTCPMKFKDPVQDKLVLKNTAYMDSIVNGQKWYTWTISVDGPWSKLQNIQKVRYKLHPTFNPNTIDVATRSAYGFPLSRRGWGTFTVQAILYFKNGATQTLNHKLAF
jgi:transcription initiation factor IIF auxiliary subunit